MSDGLEFEFCNHTDMVLAFEVEWAGLDDAAIFVVPATARPRLVISVTDMSAGSQPPPQIEGQEEFPL